MSRLADSRFRKGALRLRVLFLPTLLFFALAGGFIYFLTTRFDLDWAKTWGHIQDLNPWLYALAIVLYYLSFIFRGMRWRILGRNSASRVGHHVTVPSAWVSAQLIVTGWSINAISWFRLGDAYRAYAFSERSGGTFPWSLGTVLAERIIDLACIFVLLLVAAVAFSASLDSNSSRSILLATFGMVAAATGLLLVMGIYGPRLEGLLPTWLARAYRRFHQGTLDSLKQLPLVFVLSLVGWLLEAGRLYFVVLALDLSIGLPLVLIVALAQAILSTVPTPGGVGAVEPGLTGLLALSLAGHEALSVTLVDRSITYLSVIVVGGAVFLLINFANTRRSRKSEGSGLGAQHRHGVPSD